jgi:uracil-DNA glycosylase
MSDDADFQPTDDREALAAIAGSLRAYLEFHAEAGTIGFPRGAAARVRVPAPVSETEAAPVAARAMPPGLESIAPASVSGRVEHGLPEADLIPPAAKMPEVQDEVHELKLDKPAPVAVERPREVAMLPEARKQALEVLGENVAQCTKCGLSGSRTNTVVFRGNPEAVLMIVGEAPGADEDAQGLPFVGKAGQLLDRMVVAMGLQPSQIYVCNIIKCRPPENRRPAPEEVTACMPYLTEQIAMVEPKVILAMGNTAVSALLGSALGISKVRGQWKLYKGKTLLMPTFHPSYLLRPGPQQQEAKKQVWEDLQLVMKELGLK